MLDCMKKDGKYSKAILCYIEGNRAMCSFSPCQSLPLMREVAKPKVLTEGESMKDYNKENIPLAKTLRKNMTPWERKLWYDFLRGYPVRFPRKKAIGNYIVDFSDRQGSLPQSASLTALLCIKWL